MHGASHAKPRVMWLQGREQRQVAFTSRSDTGELVLRPETAEATAYLSSKFRSTSDGHGGSLLLVGFQGERSIREQLF